MVSRPVMILGGLPAWADVSYGKDADTPNGPGECRSEVEELYWRKRDGSKGSPLPDHLFDRALSYGNDYQGCDIIEQVNNQLSYEAWERRAMRDAVELYQRGDLDIGARYAGELLFVHRSPWGF